MNKVINKISKQKPRHFRVKKTQLFQSQHLLEEAALEKTGERESERVIERERERERERDRDRDRERE